MFITRECDYAVRVVRALWGESRLSVSDICEKLTVLNFGQVLASGNTSDVLNNPQVIKAYLGE